MEALAAKGHGRVVLVRSGCVLAADAVGFFDEALSYASEVGSMSVKLSWVSG